MKAKKQCLLSFVRSSLVRSCALAPLVYFSALAPVAIANSDTIGLINHPLKDLVRQRNDAQYLEKSQVNHLLKSEVDRHLERIYPTLNTWLVVLLILPMTTTIIVWLFFSQSQQKSWRINQDLLKQKAAGIDKLTALMKNADILVYELQEELEKASQHLQIYEAAQDLFYPELANQLIPVQYQDAELVSPSNLIYFKTLSSLTLKASDLETIEQLSLSFDTYINQGNELLFQGLYEGAKAKYDLAVKVNQNNALVWFNLGFVEAKLGKYEEAIASYEQAIAIQPNYVEPWIERGRILEKLKRYAEALTSYKRATNINPECFAAWAGYCRALALLNHFTESLEWSEKVAKFQSDYYI